MYRFDTKLPDRLVYSTCIRVSNAQGNQGKWQKKICQGKHKEFENVAKTQGIWFAQVVNSLIVKVKDIAIFVAKVLNI